MPITQILLTANRIAVPTYTLTPAASTVIEGSSLTFTVGGTNIPDGIYVWIIETGSAEFATTSGTVTVTNNSGTFSVTPTADATAEGLDTFTVSLRANIYDPNLVTSSSVTINGLVMSLTADGYSGSGSSWEDNSGLSRTGGLINAPVFTNTSPKYFTFNRNSLQFVQGTVIGDLPKWTVESWFRLSEPLSSSITTAVITTTYDSAGVVNYALSNFVVGGDGTVLNAGFFDGVGGDSGWHNTSGFVPDTDTWYHVIGTYDGTTLKQWVNGSLDSQLSVTANTTANGGAVRIARRWDSAASAENYFPGDIATAKIYNYALSETEIASAFNSSKATYRTYTITPAADNVDEGSSLEFTVGGTFIADGTYYWTVTNSGDFGTASGSFTITSNVGTFSVTPTADDTTEGSETFTVSIRSGSISGTVLATSDAVTINDTSISVAPFSLLLNSAQSDYLTVASSSDWLLGTTWTVEYWMKANSPTGSGERAIMSQYDAGYERLDIYHAGGDLAIDLGRGLRDEPTVGGVPYAVSDWQGQGGWNQGFYSNLATTGGTGTGLTVDVAAGGGGYINISAITINTPGSGYTDGDVITITNEYDLASQFTISATSQGVWTHVAMTCSGSGSTDLNVYYNGANVYNGSTYNLGMSGPISVGRRGVLNSQYFDGKLAMIRISNAVKYATDFTPSTTYGVESDTKLFLGSDTPLVDTSAGDHTITNYGITQSTDFPEVYTVRQWLSTYSGGGTNTNLYALLADYPDAATIPAGATAVINGTVVNVGDNASSTYNGEAVRLLSITPQIPITAGTTVTFTW